MGSKCSCASFFNVTSGSGLVVTESAGACVLSDSRQPWCIVNETTCKHKNLVHQNRGEAWDYCAGLASLIVTRATKLCRAIGTPVVAMVASRGQAQAVCCCALPARHAEVGT